jgi:hypothetical protein
MWNINSFYPSVKKSSCDCYVDCDFLYSRSLFSFQCRLTFLFHFVITRQSDKIKEKLVFVFNFTFTLFFLFCRKSMQHSLCCSLTKNVYIIYCHIIVRHCASECHTEKVFLQISNLYFVCSKSFFFFYLKSEIFLSVKKAFELFMCRRDDTF